MPNCKECRKFLKVITNTHLKYHNMTMAGYQIKYPESPIREQETIDKMYSAENIARMSKRMSELRLSGGIRIPPMSLENRRLVSERMTTSNPMKNPDVVNKVKATRKTRVYNIFRTDEQKQHYRECKLGDRNPMKNPETAMKSAMGHNRKKSGIEILFDKVILDYKLPLKYVGNNKLWVGCKNPDYVDTEDKKLVIEITSDAYHRLENNYEETRIKHFNKYGYRCITIRYTKCNKRSWEILHKNLGELLTKILYAKYSYQIYHSTDGETTCIQF